MCGYSFSPCTHYKNKKLQIPTVNVSIDENNNYQNIAINYDKLTDFVLI